MIESLSATSDAQAYAGEVAYHRRAGSGVGASGSDGQDVGRAAEWIERLKAVVCDSHDWHGGVADLWRAEQEPPGPAGSILGKSRRLGGRMASLGIQVASGKHATMTIDRIQLRACACSFGSVAVVAYDICDQASLAEEVPASIPARVNLRCDTRQTSVALVPLSVPVRMWASRARTRKR